MRTRLRLATGTALHRIPRSNQAGDLQYAALPYRFAADGARLVMLLTSRETRRWVIPKGWPMPGRKPHRVAETEALEEGGVTGALSKKSIGSYHYTKDMPDGEQRLLRVEVYPLLVTAERPTWREADERTRQWFAPEMAASLVAEGGLALIIGEFDRARSPLMAR